MRINARFVGAKGDGKTDDAPAIQKAIDAIKTPGAVLLPAGTYLLKKSLHLRSGVVLRGAGPDKTHLRMKNPTRGSAVVDISERGGASLLPKPGAEAHHLPLKSGFDAGSARLQLLKAADGLRPGRYIALFCDNNDPKIFPKRWAADYARNSKGQVLRVKAVRGADVEIDRPLRLSYSKKSRPRIVAFDPIVRAGVEDLHIWRADDRFSCLVRVYRAAECWVRNCHTEYCRQIHVSIQISRGIVVRDSYMHHAHSYGNGGHGYGVRLGRWVTDCLVENNVFDHLRHAMMTSMGANGNVFGYNVSRRCVWYSDISQHGFYSYMNLFEGNVVQRIAYADYWGPTGPLSTCFRNRVENSGLRGKRHGIDDGPAILMKDQSRANILLNTLLTQRIHASRNAWVEKNLFLKAKPSGKDAQTKASTAPSWTLPASLYLKKKPSWWGERPWPAIGADVDLRALRTDKPLQSIPAEQRLQTYMAEIKK